MPVRSGRWASLGPLDAAAGSNCALCCRDWLPGLGNIACARFSQPPNTTALRHWANLRPPKQNCAVSLPLPPDPLRIQRGFHIRLVGSRDQWGSGPARTPRDTGRKTPVVKTPRAGILVPPTDKSQDAKQIPNCITSPGPTCVHVLSQTNDFSCSGIQQKSVNFNTDYGTKKRVNFPGATGVLCRRFF